MSIYSNPDDHNVLSVDHDHAGRTILAVTDTAMHTNNYGIPSTQLPRVLFDMTGGVATPEETHAAEDFLRDPQVAGGTVEDHISIIRNTILALAIRLERDERDGTIVDAEVVDEYDTLTPEQLLYEAKSLRASNHDLMNGREAVLNKLNATTRELKEVRKVLQAIHGAIGKVAGEEAQHDAR